MLFFAVPLLFSTEILYFLLVDFFLTIDILVWDKSIPIKNHRNKSSLIQSSTHNKHSHTLMETETILQQLYSFAESKDSELYKKAKIILDSIRETLQVNTMGIMHAWVNAIINSLALNK